MYSKLKSLLTICFALAVSFLAGSAIGLAYSINPLIFGLVGMLVSLIPLGLPSGSLTMAVTQNTLIGRSRNKIGGAVFRTWKGLNVLQSKPLTVANPDTVAQQFQRNKMRALVNMFRQYLAFLRLSFNEFNNGTTPWATFVGKNLKAAFSGSPPTPTFVPEDLIVSSGTLVNPSISSFSNPSGRNISISWVDNSGQPGANASDRAVIVCATGAGEVYFLTDGSNRSDATMTVTVPGSTSLSSFECHFYMDNQSLRKSSDSISLGTV